VVRFIGPLKKHKGLFQNTHDLACD
jgi:hypothetical protein